ncbi:inducible alternative oxidase 2 [Saitoella coloradoensis]
MLSSTTARALRTRTIPLLARQPGLFASTQRLGATFAYRYVASSSANRSPHSELRTSTEGISEYIWHHPVYTDEQINGVKIMHRECKSWSDKVALTAVRVMRWCFDFATGYKHSADVASGKVDASSAQATQQFAMTPEKWLIRIIFLESIAGVPGMVGGACRHLRSLRVLKPDNGRLETLLSEAENERMHLLTFLEMRHPGWFMRTMIILGQGVFYNLFFASYLVSPRTCHRFVGFLEEEAVITYTRCIADLDAGKLPAWKDHPAPEIAKRYWGLGDDATLRDVFLVVRADEANHRHVNHSYANLGPDDPNPFREGELKTGLGEDVVAEMDMDREAGILKRGHARADLKDKGIGFEKNEMK